MKTQDSTSRRKRASTSFGSPLLSFRPKSGSRQSNTAEILKFPRDRKASQSFQFSPNQKLVRNCKIFNLHTPNQNKVTEAGDLSTQPITISVPWATSAWGSPSGTPAKIPSLSNRFSSWKSVTDYTLPVRRCTSGL